MSASPKHVPFDSIYRPNFEVVEERRGRVSLFPHTEQLPLLLRALNLEFYGALADKIARVDKRADGYHKYLLNSAALMFSAAFNAGRKDGLHLYSLADADLVAGLALVQQVTEDTPLGKVHRFRFYGRNGFFQDIHLSGKRLAFADHVLQRFSMRVPNRVGEDLSFFLLTVFGSCYVGLPVGQTRAFVLPYKESVLAFTYTESAEEYFLTTCLTAKEMNSLKPELPPQVFNLHYGREFTRPKLRTWIPTAAMAELYQRWRNKVPPPQVEVPAQFRNWRHIAAYVRDAAIGTGFGPGTQIYFHDHIPGPHVIECKPGQPPGAFDELTAYKQAHPDVEWDAVFAESAKLTSESPEEHQRRTRR